MIFEIKWLYPVGYFTNGNLCKNKFQRIVPQHAE